MFGVAGRCVRVIPCAISKQDSRFGFTERIKVPVDERLDLSFGKPRVPSFAEHAPNAAIEDLLSLGFANRDGAFANDHAATAKCFNHAVCLKLVECASHRIGVERDLAAERANARQKLPRTERSCSDSEFDLPHKLQVNRDITVDINGKKHGWTK